MYTEGLLKHTDAIAMLGLAFKKDYGLIPSSETIDEYSPIRFSPSSDYESVNPLRGLISTYLDLNIGEALKGTSIEDWLNMDIAVREMLLSELKLFEDRKAAAVAAAKKEAETTPE